MQLQNTKVDETKPDARRKRSGMYKPSAGLKLGATMLLVLAVALGPRRPHVLYLAPACVLALTWVLVRMPVLFALKRILVVEPFIVGVALLALFRPETQPVFFAALIKSNLCVLAMLLLGYTTPFHELLRALRRAHVPGVLVTTLALLDRYLPVLIEESVRMQRARASRTFSRRRNVAWLNMAGVAARLFVRAADRAERIYLAMCARGWK
ncbi:MAG: energy-coupling factor transporter transmembrane protein EcfT [Verrucomicrobiae bacterium]|nr:energy-coupling factor transporter transmembrane protein EcfT [Verrucomicrobiae bacterium]MCX7723117.1 energy-coupling factor transporter transmembrane protein EcfT [Verrucomicrobiae bacterium]MDW7980630.1 energy-coupling factor transporter transmembrane component T [Verrucomicrobiales bacterium]